MNKRRTIVLPSLGELVLSGARPISAIILALIAGAVVIWVAGANPIEAYAAVLRGSIGSAAALANTGVRAIPLLFGGFAVGLGLKAGLQNIGGDGQMYFGGLAATVVGLIPLPVPAWLHLLLAVLAGFAGGALGILLPAYFRAYRGVSEVNTTFMLNYIAAYVVSWLLHVPTHSARCTFAHSSEGDKPARWPCLGAGHRRGLALCAALHLLWLSNQDDRGKP